jgi:hypothetical protein
LKVLKTTKKIRENLRREKEKRGGSSPPNNLLSSTERLKTYAIFCDLVKETLWRKQGETHKEKASQAQEGSPPEPSRTA